jgi:hypothetical protein
MRAELYYRYDKKHKLKEFALVADNNWIWFYLGENLKGIKITLYPYKPSGTLFGDFKLLKSYEYNGCHEIADWIAKRIKSKLK